ncbi:MBL fold metallo-hydrolase [Candidatus Gracilibacteria bacterium]|nr:MBL fold metallo-hydrolase [Candidatus Gracilibacteria bacterium]NJM89224.1 MBL fold metallo-hydrolase [Hydrococcus sp. RU_2_2]NJP21110.1 MBL fold metallo-hydrolase [Hydrococcus sp. CRU_1_1]NJQ97711.1 MBL fold metallo-hydrolase [Hydrococcus sp. CSU_1_8]
MFQPAARITKSPRNILEGLFAFPPNRETLGGTSYFIVEKAGNISIDCPPSDREYEQFLLEKGGVRWLFLTHRGGIGKNVKQMQAVFGCEVLIQEQEAYLLPEVNVTRFEQEFNLSSSCSAIWTPGHSPGSSCLYWNHHGGVLFCGRHLLPDKTGTIAPLRTAKTFHWFRQLQRVKSLRDRFNNETLQYICPGANTGFLRGKGTIEKAYQQLSNLDLEQLRQAQAWL